MGLTACLVISNEEKLLFRCLSSLNNIADEIIVVHDGKCRDKSLEIAKQFKAKIFTRPYIGEAEYHRPFSYRQAQGKWILQIDADEFLSEKAIKAIPTLIQNEAFDAYSFAWPYFVGGSYVKRGPFAKTFKPCLFRKEKMFMIGISHEYPRTYGRLQKRPEIQLEHKPVTDNFTWETFHTKWTQWARLQARQINNIEDAPTFNIPLSLAKKGFSYYIFIRKHPIISGLRDLLRFIIIYLKRGILIAGWPSLRIAYFELSYLFLVRKYLSALKHGAKI